MSFSTDPTSTSQNPTPNVGELGERLVAEWLQTQNWVILHHRWRCRWGEIDLIALEGERRTRAEENSIANLESRGKFHPPRTQLGYELTPSPLLAFIEVKTRSSRNWDADGWLAITPQKQAKLWQSAQLFLAEHPDLANLPCRFDVALVNYQGVSQRSRRANQATVEEHHTNSSPSPAQVDKAIKVSPIQLGQPIFTAGYRLILQEYIPSAFDERPLS